MSRSPGDTEPLDTILKSFQQIWHPLSYQHVVSTLIVLVHTYQNAVEELLGESKEWVKDFAKLRYLKEILSQDKVFFEKEKEERQDEIYSLKQVQEAVALLTSTRD